MRATIALLVGLAAGGLWASPAAAGAGAGAGAGREYYVAVGGSAAVGVQPSPGSTRGEPTDDGYANDLVLLERSRWPQLELVQTGCPSETTETMIDGGDRCYAAPSSQLGTVTAFLRANTASTVLVTVDIGFNDLLRCLRDEGVDQPCVSRALDRVQTQLPEILDDIQAVSGPDTKIVGLNHYDPYIADERGDAHERSFALQTVGVIQALDDLLARVYDDHRIPVANVRTAFADYGVSTSTADAPGVSQVCALTWMCAAAPSGPNPHPNDAGYRAIASAIADAIADA